MAPPYWPSAQAADWQRPAQTNPFHHAVYLPVNGYMQCNMRDPNTLVGPGQANQPAFAGPVRPPPPPAPRDNGSVNINGVQPGAPQARAVWTLQRLHHLQHAHPSLGQHSHQQQTFVRHATQPYRHKNGQQPNVERRFSSWTALSGSAKPFIPGSPRCSTASSSTADKGEASDLSSAGSTSSSPQASIAGEQSCPLLC